MLSVPVYAPRALLGDAVEEGEGTPTSDGLPLVARRIGPPLEDVIGELDIPRVGILLLQPVTVEMVGALDPDDPCEQDPQNYAFEDWQLADGSRLIYYAWPGEWRSLPARDQRWRNRIAYTIFNAEQSLDPGQALPWEGVGVPIGLVAFSEDDSWTPLFLDRYSVVRQGGKPRRRTPLAGGSGNPFLHQARFQQFAEQVTEQAPNGDVSLLPVGDLARQFRYLPPVGLLPTGAIDISAGRDDMRDRFFPYAYDVDVAPAPAEQLDAVLQENASLAPFDTFAADQVRVLMPVPQRLFEPHLLKVELVDPVFQETIDRFALERAQWLRRRGNVRGKARAIVGAITGEVPPEPTPEDDPGRLEDESEDTLNVRPLLPAAAHYSELRRGPHRHFFQFANPPFSIDVGDVLVAYVYLDPANPPSQVMLQWNSDDGRTGRAYWGANRIELGADGTETRRYMGPLPAAGRWARLEIPPGAVGLEGAGLIGMDFILHGGRAAWANIGKFAGGEDILWYQFALPEGAVENMPPDESGTLPPVEPWQWVEADNLPAPFEDNYQTAQANGLRSVVPVQELKQTLSAGPLTGDEIAELDSRGVERFIEYLEDKVKRADARIDLGYLRVNTDIYRIRQLVLGTEAASRLAVSPALASIAQGETAAASQQQIASFYQRLVESPVQRRDEPPAASGTTGTDPGGQGGGSASGPEIGRTLFSTTFTGSLSFGGLTFQPPQEPAGPSGPTAAELLNLQSGTQPLLFSGLSRPSTIDDVVGKSPIVGKTLDRTTTIAERFQTPRAPEAKDYTAATKHDVVIGLMDLGISLEGIQVPGVATGEVDPDTGQPSRTARPLLGLTSDDLTRILDDPDSTFGDEAAFFSASVDLADHTISVLGAVEGRVQGYRQAIAACRRLLDQLRGLVRRADLRLKAIEDGLAEARHDASVARALLAEEEARVGAINQRRDQIIREHVHFLVFYRPRTADLLAAAPVRPLNAGQAGEPVVACLSQAGDLPSELGDVVALLREAPARWFVRVFPLLDRLDRLDVLRDVMQTARLRAQATPVASAGIRLTNPANNVLGNTIKKVFSAQQQTISQMRVHTAQLDPQGLASQNWGLLRDQARNVLSPSDILDGRHGRSDLTQQVSAELDRIARVTACLHRAFGNVLPALRLAWAENLSQFDEPVNLRNLSNLPRWGEIGYLDRQEMQNLVDWLYQRIDPRIPEAVSLVSDLVRIAILLASHAPVDQIIAGRILEPATVQKGGKVRVAVDLNRVHVGMHILVYQGNQVVARGMVEDLSTAEVSARIVQSAAPVLHVDQNARVQFMEPSGSPLTQLGLPRAGI